MKEGRILYLKKYFKIFIIIKCICLYSKIQNVNIFMRYEIHLLESIVEIKLNIRVGVQKYQLNVYWIISIFDLNETRWIYSEIELFHFI